MATPPLCIAYITTANRTEARLISCALLQEKLIACANIINASQSLYRWKGKLVESKESVIIAKTTNSHSKKIIARVKQLHSYDCPCIVFVPIVAANPEYAEWIQENVG